MDKYIFKKKMKSEFMFDCFITTGNFCRFIKKVVSNKVHYIHKFITLKYINNTL